MFASFKGYLTFRSGLCAFWAPVRIGQIAYGILGGWEVRGRSSRSLFPPQMVSNGVTCSLLGLSRQHPRCGRQRLAGGDENPCWARNALASGFGKMSERQGANFPLKRSRVIARSCQWARRVASRSQGAFCDRDDSFRRGPGESSLRDRIGRDDRGNAAARTEDRFVSH